MRGLEFEKRKLKKGNSYEQRNLRQMRYKKISTWKNPLCQGNFENSPENDKHHVNASL